MTGESLQWGRTLSSAEVILVRPTPIRGSLASMGPHSFKCGSSTQRKSSCLISTRFNGAALFQVRKLGVGRLGGWEVKMLQWGRTLSSAEVRWLLFIVVSLTFASMGPHSFKCGSRNSQRTAEPSHSRFNGAALFQVRKSTKIKEGKANGDRLQWGRTLSSAEVGNAHHPPSQNQQASMGPHSFKCGSKSLARGNSPT